MNYKEVGKNPFIRPEDKKGVALVNNLVKSLHEQGLLPKRFSTRHQAVPLETKAPKVQAEKTLDPFEDLWQKEIKELDSYVKTIREAVSNKDENTLKGFDDLLTNLSNQTSQMIIRRDSNFSIEEVLGVFEENSEAYKKSTKRPHLRKPSGNIIKYHSPGVLKRGNLTPRQMRILFFSYGLLPNQTKSLEDLAKEEEIKSPKQTRELAERHIIWRLRPWHH